MSLPEGWREVCIFAGIVLVAMACAVWVGQEIVGEKTAGASLEKQGENASTSAFARARSCMLLSGIGVDARACAAAGDGRRRGVRCSRRGQLRWRPGRQVAGLS